MFWNISCLVFSEFPEYVVWVQALIWYNSQSLLFQMLFLFFFLFFLLVFPLHVGHAFYIVPQSLNSLLTFSLFSLFLSFWLF